MSNKNLVIQYISNVRLPTEKAHGVAILNACNAFAMEHAKVILLTPVRKGAAPLEDVFKHYGLEKNFAIERLFSIDLYGIVPEKIAFFVQTISFYCSVFLRSFSLNRNYVYTRDLPIIFLRFFGFKVIYECHTISSFSGIFSFLLRMFSYKIVVISSGIKNFLVERGISEKFIFVAPSGVDLKLFNASLSTEAARNDLGIPQDEFVAVYSGNFTTMGMDKGVEDVLRAFSKLSKGIFIAVGGGHADVLRYGELVKKLGLSRRVKLIGTQPQSLLAKYHRAADVLIMFFPSRSHYISYMSPVKMFEYMASGKPIIASDLPSIREVLDEYNSFLVPPGNVEELTGLLGNPDYLRQEGAKRAQKALGRVGEYAWDVRAKKIIRFIAS